MYDFFVDIETDNIRLQELINRLKKQVAGIKLNEIPVPQSPASINRAVNPRGKDLSPFYITKTNAPVIDDPVVIYIDANILIAARSAYQIFHSYQNLIVVSRLGF